MSLLHPFNMLLLITILCILSPPGLAGAADRAGPTLAPRGEADHADLASAVEMEASVSAERWHSTRSKSLAVAYPTNVAQDVPEYELIRQMMPALPLVQRSSRSADADARVESVRKASSGDGGGDSISDGAVGVLADALRVMVVGDSITQGREGDWTWRYRIWQWFQQNDVSMRFVGPYTGTVEPAEASVPRPPGWYDDDGDGEAYRPKTKGGYARGADSRFTANSNHFALWGRAAAVTRGVIKGVLEEHPADLMLIMLGFNDVAWFYSDWEGTISSIKEIVDNARDVNPKMKFAIANIPHRLYIRGFDNLIINTNLYNGNLPRAISDWSTRQSPIHIVDIAKHYDCSAGACPAGESPIWYLFLFSLGGLSNLASRFKC